MHAGTTTTFRQIEQTDQLVILESSCMKYSASAPLSLYFYVPRDALQVSPLLPLTNWLHTRDLGDLLGEQD